MNRFNPWSNAVLFRLRQLCDERPRPAFYRIARILNEEFDLTLTANACIGKAYRILSGAQSWQSPALQLPTPLRPMPPIEAEIDPPQPGEVGISIYQLRHNSCRWPFGACEAPYRFCGKKALESMPYCSGHCRLAYATPKMR